MTTSAILKQSQDDQFMLDALLQTAKTFVDRNGAHLHHHIQTLLTSDVATCINDLRRIEQALFSAIGVSYTYNRYDPNAVGFTYINRTAIPQFTTVSAFLDYYKRTIALCKGRNITQHAVANFVSDGEGQSNGDVNNVYVKANYSGGGTPWPTYEQDLITVLGDIVSVLNGETPDLS